jgi:hypothetical protein
MDLQPMNSFEELLGHGSTSYGDTTLLQNLKELYNNDIELLDAYVGALLEPKQSKLDTMSPLFVLSLTDQFARVRDGDRLWYKNTFSPEEYNQFPNLSEMIKLVCDDMDLFPSDPYLLYKPTDTGGDGSCSANSNAGNQLNLLEYVLFVLLISATS